MIALSSSNDASSNRSFSFCRFPPFIDEFRMKLRLLFTPFSGDSTAESSGDSVLFSCLLPVLRTVSKCDRLIALESTWLVSRSVMPLSTHIKHTYTYTRQISHLHRTVDAHRQRETYLNECCSRDGVSWYVDTRRAPVMASSSSSSCDAASFRLCRRGFSSLLNNCW